MPSASTTIVWLSLQITAAALAISVAVGVPFGAWLGEIRFPGKRLVTALIYTGMGLPPVVVGLVVYLLLSRDGPLGNLHWLFSPAAMILAQTIIALPLVAGLTQAAFEAIPADLSLQVRSLGASPWQVRAIILREALPGVALAVAAAFGRIFSEVGAAMLVGGNIEGHTRVLSTAIVLETSKGRFALALTLGGWLLTVALVVNLLMFRLQGRRIA